MKGSTQRYPPSSTTRSTVRPGGGGTDPRWPKDPLPSQCPPACASIHVASVHEVSLSVARSATCCGAWRPTARGRSRKCAHAFAPVRWCKPMRRVVCGLTPGSVVCHTSHNVPSDTCFPSWEGHPHAPSLLTLLNNTPPPVLADCR